MASSSSSQKIVKLFRAYMRIVDNWPADRLRPTHCFRSTLRDYVQREFQPDRIIDKETLTRRIAVATRQVNALNKIVTGDVLNSYPLPSRLRHPVDKPTYYDDLLKAIDSTINQKESPKRGIRWLFSKW